MSNLLVVAALQEEKVHLEGQLTALQSRYNHLLQENVEMATRIHVLETKLGETHQAEVRG